MSERAQQNGDRIGRAQNSADHPAEIGLTIPETGGCAQKKEGFPRTVVRVNSDAKTRCGEGTDARRRSAG